MSCRDSFNMDETKENISSKIAIATKMLTLQTKFDLDKNLQFLLTANSNHV
jgi:hypothetical protein